MSLFLRLHDLASDGHTGNYLFDSTMLIYHYLHATREQNLSLKESCDPDSLPLLCPQLYIHQSI